MLRRFLTTVAVRSEDGGCKSMGRYIGPKNKQARRFGVNLGLKINPTKVARRLQQPPGAHGAGKRKGKISSFGKQLLEKQKAKIIYGLRERQFSRYVREATRKTGDSGVYLQQMLERRLDNLIYRTGFAQTRAQARQMVTHSMFLLNDEPMNIPSHSVSPGDIIRLKPTKSKKKLFEGIAERLAKTEPKSWFVTDPSGVSIKITGHPTANDAERVCDVQMIIGYYSAR